MKCDKLRPTCARCARLGIECSVQLRGRGRPPNSARTEAERADAKARRAALAAGDRNLSFNSTNSFGAGSSQSSFGGLTPRSGVGGGSAPGGE